MAQNDYKHIGRQGAPENRAIQNQPTNVASVMASEEEVMADVDEPPDERRAPRPSCLKLHESFKASFSKTQPLRSDRKQSLLTDALHSNNGSPTEEHPAATRGLSSASTWSNPSASPAELTSDGGFTSPGTRASTPSPPLPPSMPHSMVPLFNKPSFFAPASVAIAHEEENIGPLQKAATSPVFGEQKVEAGLGRKRCISFACGRKDPPKPVAAPEPAVGTPKRVPTIKFACPSKISTHGPSSNNKPRLSRAVSPAPVANRSRASPKASPKSHRDSDSTVRNASPVSVRKAPMVDRTRRLSLNSDLARCEAFRFHEFASSEEEIDEWLQESTCHRSRLTISDTLKVENTLRQLGEEAEEEALDDEQEDEEDAEDGNEEMDDDDEYILDEDEDEDEDEEDADSDVTDEGFQTDDEEGFAGSDDESDAGSDYNWWAPGHSTAATSMEHLDLIRPTSRRSVSESSIASLESESGFAKKVGKGPKRKRSRPVNIRVPSPELPDSTDFVCGTLDEDRPLEAAYMTCLERRRAAKHKITPQDIDPTFPTSDPEMDEEDDDDEPDKLGSESDQHLMMHGQMDTLELDMRGRRKDSLQKKGSPQPSPKRLRSPPPPAKRGTHRSPPPPPPPPPSRKLFGHSPKRQRSPAPVRLRSPPPTRRGSSFMSPKPAPKPFAFAGLAERPAPTVSSSLPRTPISAVSPVQLEDEDTCRETPIRRAIDIKVGLENKRQRRKEQLYKKLHRKGCKPDKKPAPGKGAERMREMGLGLAAHRGKVTAVGFAVGLGIRSPPDQEHMHVLSV